LQQHFRLLIIFICAFDRAERRTLTTATYCAGLLDISCNRCDYRCEVRKKFRCLHEPPKQTFSECPRPKTKKNLFLGRSFDVKPEKLVRQGSSPELDILRRARSGNYN
jgi:hypothetical protein